jgi:hypothetical protein
MTVKHLFISLCLLLTQNLSNIAAQNVDIQLRNTGSVLEVWLMPKADYSGSVSGLTFTISWDVAYSIDLPAAGAETAYVPAIPIQASGNNNQRSMTNGTRKYRTYGSGGGSTIGLTNNATFKIMSVAVPRTSSAATGTFSISNDAFTSANNLNYYFDIGGRDITGTTSSLATNVTIPLELIEFKAIEQNNSAYLTWKTASEINFSHFEVERSTDAKEWTKISIVKGGNTEGVYFLIDAQAFNQSRDAINRVSTLYRLKMVNMDSSFKYSKVVSVEQKERTKNSIKLYPNPTYQTIQLTMESPNEALKPFDIIDMSGKVWQKNTMSLLKGLNQVTIPVQALPAGVYFFQTLDNKDVKTAIQFVKL